MVLNKLFGKKKEEKYFLEIDTKTENQSSVEVAVNEKDSTVNESTTEGKETSVTATTKTKVDVSYDVPDWVKAIKNYSRQGNNNGQDMEGENFAGKYVSNSVPQSRRRPGPSLAAFKNMASKINR
jgi:hypothetical protein